MLKLKYRIIKIYLKNRYPYPSKNPALDYKGTECSISSDKFNKVFLNGSGALWDGFLFLNLKIPKRNVLYWLLYKKWSNPNNSQLLSITLASVQEEYQKVSKHIPMGEWIILSNRLESFFKEDLSEKCAFVSSNNFQKFCTSLVLLITPKIPKNKSMIFICNDLVVWVVRGCYFKKRG